MVDFVSTGLVATGVLFVIGLLVGIVIKKTVKLGVAILGLILILAATGYIAFSPQQIAEGIIQRAYQVGSSETVRSQAQGLASILPYTSLAFIFGLALGIWKG